MLTFAEARRVVEARWPDYSVAPYGYETETDWLLLLLPETAGGRIAAVSKATGVIRWINETSGEYTQERPVGSHRVRN